jgi:hypothetical protein
MPLRISDLKGPFLAALDAIGYPAELGEIAWINANMPLVRGPVKNNGTLGWAWPRVRSSVMRGGTGARPQRGESHPRSPLSTGCSSMALSIQPGSMLGAERWGRSSGEDRSMDGSHSR